MKNSNRLDLLLYLWHILFLISLICCFRAVTSISIALIIVTGSFKQKNDTGKWISYRLKNGFLITCVLLFLFQAIEYLVLKSQYTAAKELQLKTAIPLVPLAVCCSSYLNSGIRQKLMRWYVWILTAVLFFCLLYASYKVYFLKAPGTVFLYHDFVSPFKQHAVQVSIYAFIGLLFLLENARKGVYLYKRYFHLLLILFITFCIILLSSKLLIAFSAACLVYYAIAAFGEKRNLRPVIFISLIIGLAAIAIVLFTQNKVSSRFTEIVSGDNKLIEQNKFDPAIYFNGLQFRMLQWRFVKEILTEQDAWFTGVAGNAQTFLDKKYITTNMYIGDGTTTDHGYLGYNTHNQFLQTLLQSGIPGLAVFVLICSALVCMAIRRKNRELRIVVLLLIMYCLNESVFETQYGITLFTFFPLFLYYGTQKIPDTATG